MYVNLQVKAEPSFMLPDQCTIELASQPSPVKTETKKKSLKVRVDLASFFLLDNDTNFWQNVFFSFSRVRYEICHIHPQQELLCKEYTS